MLIWITVALTTLCTAIEAGAEVVLKKFAGTPERSWAERRGRAGLWLLGAFMYFVIGIVYGYTLAFGTVTIANASGSARRSCSSPWWGWWSSRTVRPRCSGEDSAPCCWGRCCWSPGMASPRSGRRSTVR